MRKHVLSFVILLNVIVGSNAYSMNPAERANSNYGYSTYWRLNSGTYSYSILFYENGTATGSFVDKLPFELKSGEVIRDYTDIIDLIILPAMEEFNDLNLGLYFTYSGSYSITSDKNAFSVYDSDTTNEIEIFYGGGSGYTYWNFSNRSEFGYIFSVGAAVTKNDCISDARHEMLHCLGFSHRPENYYGFGNPNWNQKNNGVPFKTGHTKPSLRECNEDSIYGLDTVYQTNKESIRIEGYVTDNYSDGYAEAYLADAITRKLLYQAPIDKTGKFEFRLRSNPLRVKIVACSSHINKNYSVVKGTDNNTYTCIANHTSSDDNHPITGQYYKSYWIQKGNSMNRNAWRTGKNYVAMDIKYQFTPVLSIQSDATYYDIGSINLERTAQTVEEIQSVSGVKMIYP